MPRRPGQRVCVAGVVCFGVIVVLGDGCDMEWVGLMVGPKRVQNRVLDVMCSSPVTDDVGRSSAGK